MRVIAAALAVIFVLLILTTGCVFGRWFGSRRELPVWLFALIVGSSIVVGSFGWSIRALTISTVLGVVLGFRQEDRINRAGRLERRKLRRAIEGRELRFYYQPIMEHNVVELNPPVIVAAEALVRWHLPNGQIKFPGPWLDTIQAHSSLADAFDSLMWEDVATFTNLFPHIRVSVNTMPERVARWGWGVQLAARLRELGINPSHINIEVVEGTLLQDTPTVRENLSILREVGVHIALDDFGEGQANLVTFMVFEAMVDCVKIDQHLIRHPDHRAAAALITLVQSFDKIVVAEGVEEPETLDWLRSIGVSQIQGWLHAKALPLTQFASYAMQHGSWGEVEKVLTKEVSQ